MCLIVCVCVLCVHVCFKAQIFNAQLFFNNKCTSRVVSRYFSNTRYENETTPASSRRNNNIDIDITMVFNVLHTFLMPEY